MNMFKKAYFVVICFLLYGTPFAKAINIDSLRKELPRISSKREKAIAFYLIGDGYQRSGNNDSAVVYLSQSLFLTRTAEYDSFFMQSAASMGYAEDAIGH